MTDILLVDDHDLVRAGIRRLLEDQEDIDRLDEARSGEEAIACVRAQRPDVVLMDVHMPGIGGLEATRRINRYDPSIGIIVLTVSANQPYPSRLLEAGAAGYLTKDCDTDEMLEALRSVRAGERYVCSDIARQIALTVVPGQNSPFDRLSHREMQVMLMVTQGQTVQTISDKLCLSPKTVSTYRYRLFEKLGVFNDVELTRLALRYGLIQAAAV